MLKGKSFKIIITVILAVLVLFFFTGCDNKKSTDVNKEKVDEEMELLDDKIISSLNLLNNISFANYKVVADDTNNENSEEGQMTNEKSSNEKDANKESSGKQDSSSEEGSSKKSEGEDSSNKDQNETSSDEEDPNRKSKDEESSSEKGSENGESSGGSKSSQGEQEKGKIYRLTEQNILQLKSESDIKWSEIQREVESLYTIWTTITIDLKSENINNKDIVEFNKLLDSLAKAVKEKNKKDSLDNLSKIYNLIPIYMNQYSKDNTKISVYKVKSYLVNACCIVDNDDWSNIEENVNMAKKEFENVIKQNNDENKGLNINRAEIQLEDFQTSLSEEDKEIFFLKYKNLIQELNML